MELKVWVDGIQRVVCGANLSTTCQDVVVALAHAMGRTGRFTLIEKWRDSERPLTPGECPLQSLHKWGEYAAEVRFYLMQAEQVDKMVQKSQRQRQSAQPAEMEESFSHNFTPPVKPRQLPQSSQVAPEPVKRSSTFSGAHNTNYSASNSLHAKLDHLKQQQQRHQPQSQPSHHHHSLPRQPQQQQQYPQHQQQSHPYQENHVSHPSNRDPHHRILRQQQQQHHLNIPSPNHSQNTKNQSSHPHPQHKPIPIPSSHQTSRPHRLNNSSLSSPRSPNSSSPNSSPRDVSHQTPYSLSPGRVRDISPSSPGQDSRYLHPANIPQPSRTYSNHQSDTTSNRGRDYVDPMRYQPDPHKKQNTSTDSSSSPRPVPTPAPRSQVRQPSPSSQPYENLPPRRGNQSVVNSSASSPHPIDTHPTDPQRPRRRRDPQRNQANLKPENAQQLPPYGDRHHVKVRNDLPNDSLYRSDVNKQGEKQRKKSQDQRHPSPSSSSREVISNSWNYNDSHFNSDLSDDCFHNTDIPGKLHHNYNGVSQSEDMTVSRLSNPKDLTVSGNGKSAPFPPVSSQTLPSFSSSSSRGRLSESATGRMAKSQTMPPQPNPPEHVRRSEGSNRVNFVESALLRQQSSHGNMNSNSHNLDQSIMGIPSHGDSISDVQGGVEYPQQSPDSSNRTHFNSTHNKESNPDHSYMSSSPSQSFPSQPRYPHPYKHQDTNFQPPAMSHSSSSSDYPHHQNSQQQQHYPNQNLRTSAFKVVSPRSGRPNPLGSPVSNSPNNDTLIAYNLDNQNFDLPVNYEYPSISADTPLPITDHHHHYQQQQQQHSRNASLEIEEYDLDENFPDVFQKDHQSSTLPRNMGRKNADGKLGQGHHTEYVIDRPKSSSMEPEYMRLLRQVKMQQERLKMAESQVNELDAEIATLEADQSNLDLKFDVVGTELGTLEQAEERNLSELDDLERVEWVNVLDGETKCEQDLMHQMSKLRVELTQVEDKLGEMETDEEAKKAEVEKEKKIIREKERETFQALEETKADMSKIEETLKKREEEMKALHDSIKEAEEKIKKQDDDAEKLDEMLRSENLKEFQANPVPKELPPTSKSSLDGDITSSVIIATTSFSSSSSSSLSSKDKLPVPSASVAVRCKSPSDTGEAILKILEGRLSPQTSPSPTLNDESSGTAMIQQPYMSSTAVKNPNGVWV